MDTSKTEFATAAQPSTGRIVSIDALRGFDMFWIIGADHIMEGLGKVSNSPVAQKVSNQLKHVSWEGFVFYDLIFPLFVFLLGMGIVFSLGKIVEREGKWGAHKRVFRRFLLLFILGALYDDGFSGTTGESFFAGVLQRLSWCYLFTSLLYLHFGKKALGAILAVILVGYWLLLSFVPAPDTGTIDLSTRDVKNIVMYVDEHYLPFKERGQKWDPEGLLSNIPAVGTCILGLFAGWFLIDPRVTGARKALFFMGAGVALLALGYLWGIEFPIIKRMWTSSYILVAAGYSSLLVGLFYLVVDVWGFQKWATPFIWIGVNPLTLYLVSDIVDFHNLGDRIAGGPISWLFGNYSELWIAAVGLFLTILLARFLYKRKIFLRV